MRSEFCVSDSHRPSCSHPLRWHEQPSGLSCQAGHSVLQITPRRLFLTDANEKQKGPPPLPGEPVRWWNKPPCYLQWRWKLIYWFKQQHQRQQTWHEFHFLKIFYNELLQWIVVQKKRRTNVAYTDISCSIEHKCTTHFNSRSASNCIHSTHTHTHTHANLQTHTGLHVLTYQIV